MTQPAPAPHNHDVDWAAEVCALAGSADAVGAAEHVLQRLTALVPYAGAALCGFDPIGERHVTLASAGYSADVIRYLNDRFVVSDPAYRVMRQGAGYPLRWRDTPFDYETTFSAQCVFRPAGYREGMSAPLVTPDGRYTGVLHLSTETRVHPSDHARETIHSVRSGIALIVDALRRPAWMAALFEPASHAAVVTQRQRVVPLPGRAAGPLLSADSPLVRRALDLIAADTRERTFLWEASPHVWHRVRLVPLTGAVLVMERLCSLPYGMTSRELEVLRAIVAGSSNAKIARDLVVAPRTVATHVEHLLEKLGAHSRARCAAIAAAEGLILERPSGVAAHESGGWRERIGANDAAAHRRAPRVAN